MCIYFGYWAVAYLIGNRHLKCHIISETEAKAKEIKQNRKGKKVLWISLIPFHLTQIDRLLT